MEYLFVDYAYPEFEIMTRFVKDECVRGLSLDSLRSSHPIEVNTSIITFRKTRDASYERGKVELADDVYQTFRV